MKYLAPTTDSTPLAENVTTASVAFAQAVDKSPALRALAILYGESTVEGAWVLGYYAGRTHVCNELLESK